MFKLIKISGNFDKFCNFFGRNPVWHKTCKFIGEVRNQERWRTPKLDNKLKI